MVPLISTRSGKTSTLILNNWLSWKSAVLWHYYLNGDYQVIGGGQANSTIFLLHSFTIRHSKHYFEMPVVSIQQASSTKEKARLAAGLSRKERSEKEELYSAALVYHVLIKQFKFLCLTCLIPSCII